MCTETSRGAVPGKLNWWADERVDPWIRRNIVEWAGRY